jgi:hypothetical protein
MMYQSYNNPTFNSNSNFNYPIPTMTSSPSLAMTSSGVTNLNLHPKLITTTSTSLFSS